MQLSVGQLKIYQTRRYELQFYKQYIIIEVVLVSSRLIIERRSDEIDTYEYDKNVQNIFWRRKSRKNKRKPNKETRYFIGLNNPTIIKCTHTILQKIGGKKWVDVSLSIDDVEVWHLKRLLVILQTIMFIF